MIEFPIFKFALREDLRDDKRFLPTRAEPLATGWDVRAAIPEELIMTPFQRALIPLGFRTFCPPGWWFELRSRSSSFGKKYMHSLVGTLDESYEGEALFACQYIPPLTLVQTKRGRCFAHEMPPGDALIIKPGDALGQIVPVRRQEMSVEEVTNEEYNALCRERNASRGAGGFGSTGR